jgi:hypothetical protein
MVIPIDKQGGRATYYYPGDGYLRRYDDFGVTQTVLRLGRAGKTRKRRSGAGVSAGPLGR